MSSPLVSLFHCFDADPYRCWIDLHCHHGKWSIVLGPENSRQGTVFPVEIWEARRFLRFVHGPKNVSRMIAHARYMDESGWPLGCPVSVGVQLEAA